MALSDVLSAESFLEYAFLRWILSPAAKHEIVDRVKPQYEVIRAGHAYRVDYAIVGQDHLIAVELDGFAFHGNRSAFSYDRLRQNDLHAAGWIVVRFSYDSIRLEPERCVAQLQSVLQQDTLLASLLMMSACFQRLDGKPIDADVVYRYRLIDSIADGNAMKEFGLSKFKQLCPVINGDVDKAWDIYKEAIEAAKQGRGNPQLYQAPESSLAPESYRAFPVSQQVSVSSVAKKQPPEQKRSWLDHLFRRR